MVVPPPRLLEATIATIAITTITPTTIQSHGTVVVVVLVVVVLPDGAACIAFGAEPELGAVADEPPLVDGPLCVVVVLELPVVALCA
jgi:hypothetical protein